jgi:galactokinase
MPPSRVRAFAPGRVNLIGEHTDYNDGLCLPFAIERGITVTAEPLRGGDAIEARALDLGEDDRFPPGGEHRGGATGWRLFVRGAAAELRRAGVAPVPCRLEISGDLPRGAGLSSSAALSVALSLALCAAAEAEVPEWVALARLCSRIESEWCGQETGLLDQLASLFGREGHAVRIDMRGPDMVPVPLDLAGHLLVTLDSRVARRLSGSGYNERRRECRRAAAELGVATLRDATPEAAARLPPPLDRRVRHVLSENERVEATVAALGRGDLDQVGRLLDAAHASLRDDYEVSVPEVERAVAVCQEAGALGARIMGGGFGGAVLALLPPGARAPAGALPVEPRAGAHLI